MTLHVWLGFLLAAILIAVSPGPGAAVSMSTGLRYGYVSALRVIGGLQSALLIQVGILLAIIFTLPFGVANGLVNLIGYLAVLVIGTPVALMIRRFKKSQTEPAA